MKMLLKKSSELGSPKGNSGPGHIPIARSIVLGEFFQKLARFGLKR
jgi:hypothetical protein